MSKNQIVFSLITKSNQLSSWWVALLMQNLPEGEVLAIPYGGDTSTLLLHLQGGKDMPHLLWIARKHYKEDLMALSIPCDLLCRGVPFLTALCLWTKSLNSLAVF